MAMTDTDLTLDTDDAEREIGRDENTADIFGAAPTSEDAEGHAPADGGAYPCWATQEAWSRP